MRGFITFVLAAAFVLIVFSLYDEADGRSVAAQIQKLEKKYYFEMDVKRAIGKSVRLGAQEAEVEFAKCIANGNCKKGLQKLVKEKVDARIRELGEYLEGDGEWGVGMWCGKTSEGELDAIAREGNPAIAVCAQCKSVKEGCEEFVEVDLVRRVVRLQKGEIFLGNGGVSAVGFGAAEKNGEILFEAYFPPWVEIWY